MEINTEVIESLTTNVKSEKVCVVSTFQSEKLLDSNHFFNATFTNIQLEKSVLYSALLSSKVLVLLLVV